MITGQPTIEGAGVRLNRIFANNPDFDPFLLLDDFSSNNKEDFLPGFPWHPHRGIETVTYIIKGSVEHGDSIGNKGTIKDGNIQWMTAGKGIIHQEMPKSGIIGFQLWVNLPKKNKMMSPRYQDITIIPEVKEKNATIKVIAGEYNGTKGPVKDIMVNPEYYDIQVNLKFTMKLKKQTNLVYVFEGKGKINNTNIKAGQLMKVDSLDVTGKLRFLLISGKPLREPVAWHGPIVMNTQKELDLAFKELQDGNFIKFL